jgi:hypothetical protein
MAKLIPTLGTLSGSLNAIVFSHNKGGAYMRQRVKPINPGTTVQTQARSRLAFYAKLWGTIDSTTMQGWKDYAATHPIIDRQGSSMTISGQSMFVRRNAQASAVGYTGSLAAPGVLSPRAIALSSASISAANVTTINCTFAASPIASNSKIELLLSPAMSPGKDLGLSSARHASQSNDAQSSPVAFVLSPPMVAGKKHNVWLRTVGSDGSTTPEVKYTVTCPS